MPAAPMIWVNGFPGSGKFTVCEVIRQLVPDEAIILDSHKLIDPVEVRFPRIHPEYQKERHIYRQAIFRQHVYNEDTLAKLVVFTGELEVFTPATMLVVYMACCYESKLMSR